MDVSDWFNKLAAIEYDEGTGKLVGTYNKCFNLNGDYVEKQLRRKISKYVVKYGFFIILNNSV